MSSELRALRDLTHVRAGHPFRGTVPVIDDGNAHVIQMRDLKPDGSIEWQGLVRSAVLPNRTLDWLRDGDVLFTARGAHNYAVCLSNVPDGVVCSQYFFVLRCKTDALLPAYLAWHINRAPTQRYLASNAEGTVQLGIRRGVLEAIGIAVPSLARQHQIVELAAAASQEKRCLEALIHNREKQLDALADALLSPSHPNRQAS